MAGMAGCPRKQRGWLWAPGVIAPSLCGFFATLQPDAHFSVGLGHHGGVFVAGRSHGSTGSGPTGWMSSVLGRIGSVAVIMYALA